MKKTYIILFILFCFSCEDDITNNTPTFQALVNGSNEWIAENYTVSIVIYTRTGSSKAALTDIRSYTRNCKEGDSLRQK